MAMGLMAGEGRKVRTAGGVAVEMRGKVAVGATTVMVGKGMPVSATAATAVMVARVMAVKGTVATAVMVGGGMPGVAKAAAALMAGGGCRGWRWRQ